MIQLIKIKDLQKDIDNEKIIAFCRKRQGEIMREIETGIVAIEFLNKETQIAAKIGKIMGLNHNQVQNLITNEKLRADSAMRTIEKLEQEYNRLEIFIDSISETK